MPYFGMTRGLMGAGGDDGLVLVAPFTAALDLVTTVPGTAVSRSLKGLGASNTAAQTIGFVAGTATLAATGMAGAIAYEELTLQKEKKDKKA